MVCEVGEDRTRRPRSRHRRCSLQSRKRRLSFTPVHRYYDPATAQFLSVDPLDSQTRTPYAYAGSDPVNGSDPLGLSWYDPSWFNRAAIDAGSWINNEANTIVCTNLGFGNGVFAGVFGCGSASQASPSNLSSQTCLNSAGVGGSLRFLHSEQGLRNSPSYEYWSKQSTDDIVRSLAPGSSESLLVKANGTIMDGNTRVLVLKDRGYDIGSLPEDTYGPPEFPDIPDLFDG